MSVILPLLIVYGIGASILFYSYPGLRRFKPAQVLYVGGFAAMFYLYMTGQGRWLGGGAGTAMGVASFLIGVVLASGANAVAFACIGAEYAADVGRWLMSYDKIPELKTYDRAEGAESNKEYGRAARLYREKIEEDPEDVEAYRRLAEVLMELDRPEDAARVFRADMKRAEEPGDRCRVGFRLAEVLHETLDRAEEGAELYRMIAEQCPDDRRADAARARLRRMGATVSRQEEGENS